MDRVKLIEKKGGFEVPNPLTPFPKREGGRERALHEAPVLRQALGELVRGFGHEPDLISVKNLQGIADKLSQVAAPNKAGKDPAWGWRYLRNLLNGKIEASPRLASAIMALGATLDGVPDLVARGRPVQVLAVGEVRPGSVVMGSSRPCARPGCPIHFVRNAPRQRYCSRECRRKDFTAKAQRCEERKKEKK